MVWLTCLCAGVIFCEPCLPVSKVKVYVSFLDNVYWRHFLVKCWHKETPENLNKLEQLNVTPSSKNSNSNGKYQTKHFSVSFWHTCKFDRFNWQLSWPKREWNWQPGVRQRAELLDGWHPSQLKQVTQVGPNCEIDPVWEANQNKKTL